MSHSVMQERGVGVQEGRRGVTEDGSRKARWSQIVRDRESS